MKRNIFTVVWVQDAVSQLADVWLDADDRDRVTLAAYTIERQLALDPVLHGDEMSEGMRVHTVEPLRVLFTVRAADRIVEVARAKSSHSNGDLLPEEAVDASITPGAPSCEGS